MKLRKIAAAVLSLSLVCGAVPFNSAVVNDSAVYASEEYTVGTYGVLTYHNYGDYVEIYHCFDQGAEEVEIPHEIDGIPVTVIGECAFWGCTSLTNLKIPEGVVSIGNDSFEDCLRLTSVILPDTLTSIGSEAFYLCGLTSVTIPESVSSIGNRAFMFCDELTSITFLNPRCEIDEEGYTICTSASHEDGTPYYNGTIYGYNNSTAQAYAEKYGYNFESLGEYVETILGDTDLDGIVNSSDASKVLSAYAITATGGESPLSEIQKIAADVNKDDAVDSSDASSILAYYAYTATGGEGTLEEFLR